MGLYCPSHFHTHYKQGIIMNHTRLANYEKLHKLISVSNEINQFKDIDTLLDHILYEARAFSNADAGSIFFCDKDEISFEYVQNDTLIKRDPTYKKYLYSNTKLSADDHSIVGYVTSRKEILIIDDVYDLDSSVPYTFNKSFDEKSCYRTSSMMTVPLLTSRDKVIGAIQIINARDNDNHIRGFTKEDKTLITFFANNASLAIEKAKMTREIILRMIKMAELRDPSETSEHVNRVASYSIEIYQHWAQKEKISDDEIKKFKDVLRIAAMLHDVGKVAISDTILKKPGKLTNEEFKIMQTHTSQGATLFQGDVSELDSLSALIAATHHEKWNGKGYPKGLRGDEIPIAGRIVALADVYDALVSKRVYKEAWKEEDVLRLIKEESGHHFDPDIVNSFLDAYDIIMAIRNKFSDYQ